MADHQRVVDDIRSFLHSSEQSYSETLSVLATEYVEACQEANQRLRRVEEFLRQGLRGEAIHYAQSEPVLLDVLAVLDFPERALWDEVAKVYSLPAPPALRLATAEALNRAYAEAEPVANLLKQHRLLALARAPLNERLAVMRQLAEQDSGNLVWEQDINEFETVRMRQIQETVRRCFQRNDHAPLRPLYDELQATPWRVPPEPEMVQQVYDRLVQHTLSTGYATLQQLTREMLGAFRARDDGQLGRLVPEWQQLCQEMNLASDDPVHQQAAPALEWLARRQRQQEQEFGYQAALDALERGLTNGAIGEEQLQELYLQVTSYKPGVPAGVVRRYQERIENLRRATARRERFILAATISAGILVFVGLILFLLVRH
jgi:hypothetical protein